MGLESRVERKDLAKASSAVMVGAWIERRGRGMEVWFGWKVVMILLSWYVACAEV